MREATMSRVAAGAYITGLRRARKWTRARVLAELERYATDGDSLTSESQLSRIEKGEQETRGTLLVALIRVLQGNLDHLADLLLDEKATQSDGEAIARQWADAQAQRIKIISTDEKQQSAYVYRRMAELLEAGHSPSAALRLVESELTGTTEDE